MEGGGGEADRSWKMVRGKSRQRCKMVRGRDSHNKIIFIVRERVVRERERERERVTLSPLIGCDRVAWCNKINSPTNEF